jgi:hypothetical protein
MRNWRTGQVSQLSVIVPAPDRRCRRRSRSCYHAYPVDVKAVRLLVYRYKGIRAWPSFGNIES